MERIARSIQNKKQDKIALVQIQPSVNSLREGEEVLFNNSNGISMIDSHSAYKGILRAQGNMVDGIYASKSKVSCMGLVSELNNELGLRLIQK